MNTFEVTIKFKNGNAIDFELESEENLRDKIEKELESSKTILHLGQYILSISEILWIKVEGEEVKVSIQEWEGGLIGKFSR